MRGPPLGEALFAAATLVVQTSGVAVPDSAVAIGGAILIAALIALSAFFSSSEIAMFSEQQDESSANQPVESHS